MKRISIDPITRLEGHGRIDLFLNGDGGLENAYMVIPELRGFEKFCEGRRVEGDATHRPTDLWCLPTCPPSGREPRLGMRFITWNLRQQPKNYEGVDVFLLLRFRSRLTLLCPGRP